MIAPVFLAVLLGTAAYGYLFWISHSVQQLASEAARSAVGGLSDGERDAIARSFVGSNVVAYGVLDPRRIRVATAIGAAPTNSFQVTVSYDAQSLFIYQFAAIIPLPAPLVQRSAAIQRGGY